jgi:hypothetical protein
LGREDSRKLTDHLNDFVDDMKAQGRIPADLPGRFKGHAYLLYAHAERPLVSDGVKYRRCNLYCSHSTTNAGSDAELAVNAPDLRQKHHECIICIEPRPTIALDL